MASPLTSMQFKDEDDEMSCTPSSIDIDAIASAKSLGDAMRLLAPQ